MKFIQKSLHSIRKRAWKHKKVLFHMYKAISEMGQSIYCIMKESSISEGPKKKICRNLGKSFKDWDIDKHNISMIGITGDKEKLSRRKIYQCKRRKSYFFLNKLEDYSISKNGIEMIYKGNHIMSIYYQALYTITNSNYGKVYKNKEMIKGRIFNGIEWKISRNLDTNRSNS
ncbi:hypothetical protein H5410_011710 [Solanum commersonii]|uniref:Uncharacterized protein n=1 Tax=Solanum commersonii TaxID=4109 RepID=A0A9J6AQ61_SOLCO|nr:hypothetical protein H5410_011710 [Solanum commersonii]